MNAASPAEARHPRGLVILFLAEMWERFCYYGMRTLLTLYLTESLLMGDKDAFTTYGAYTALVYAAPVLGGKLADTLFGYQRAVVLGGILMAIGEFTLIGHKFFGGGPELATTLLYVGMGIIIVGNGYFKANISSIVGKLYDDKPELKDSGFTIFYIGINMGAFLATTVCAWVGATYGREMGFGLAGIGMLAGLAQFVIGRAKLEGKGLPPDEKKLNEPWAGPLSRWHVGVIGSVLAGPTLYFLLTNGQVVGWLLLAVFIYVAVTLLRASSVDGKVQVERTIALLIFMILNVFWWALFEQAGTSLTLFADRAVDRMVFGWEMPAENTQFFNPFFIIIVFGPIFSWMWRKLDQIDKNPNIPIKFGLAFLQLAAGFYMLVIGSQFAGEAYKVPLTFLALLYMLHTTGELFLSPIGLSMVTKLAPKSMAASVMGAWFLSFAGANFVGGQIAKLTGGEGESEGGEAVVQTAQQVMETYIGVYANFAYAIAGVGVLVILLNKPFNKLMHGVK
ncbi:MAG: oligopeptide:H+ symporter [Myxococcales bacterium]|nr:oligopeptide:H+ symporter [Myxococcales bacterium]